MNYLMLVCSEDAPPDADAETELRPIESWIELCGERRIYGYELDEPAAARTVRIADGATLVSDGPFIEAKEFIAGFDLLECSDLDEAVELAAAHPMAHRRMVELRPFPEGFEFNGAGKALSDAETGPGQRFMVMVRVDGIPEADEVEARLTAGAEAWGAELEAAGTMVFGNALQGIETATTVRVRSNATLLADGPFVETKEFLAGICVLRCADMDEAIAHVSRFPLAAYHPVEVRPFKIWEE
jgi:hypothetical protein